MYESKNTILMEDFEYISNFNIDFEKFRNKNILISGSTGLVGSNLIRLLLYINRIKDLNMKVYALVRNQKKASSMFNNLLTRKDLVIINIDLLDDEFIQKVSTVKYDYVIHTASITNSKIMIEKPIMTLNTSFEGTRNMLEVSKISKVASFVYISSMEVYGKFSNQQTTLVDETMMGYINPLDVRSNYPESKRICENMCIAYNTEYDIPVKIARLSQTFGAGILPGENRVFAQFANSVINNQNIVLHTEGKSEGNYCYLRDALLGIILIMLEGKNGEAYNVSNENTHMTIYEMAQLVCDKIAKGSIEVIKDIPTTNVYGYANDSRIKLDSSKLRLLGWYPSVDLEESYRRMMKQMYIF